MDLQLDDVRVDTDALLGESGRGFRIAMRALEGGRVAIAAQALGVGQAALDEAVAYGALVTSRLGLHALIGGFILGVTLHQHRPFVAEWQARIAPLVSTLFLPIFFTHTGLRTDVGSLGGTPDILLCGLVCVIAFAGKYGGGYLGARIAGEPPRVASVLGVCMNTRGLMELIVLNIGLELGVLPRSLFTQLVYMAVLTTLIATPLIRRYVRTEGIAASA
jgi:Kef-type K+ transport system membrane component KefB